MKDLEIILCAIELERRRANRRYWTLFFAIMTTALCFAFNVDRSELITDVGLTFAIWLLFSIFWVNR